MDVVNFDALIALERKITAAQVDLDEDYFILGHYDPRRREFKATDYPIYAIKARDLLAPTATNRDRQVITSNTGTSTLSSIYVDLPGISLTTNELDPVNLGASGNYQISFGCDYTINDALTTAQFILNINGVDITATQTSVGLSSGIFRTNLIWQATPLVAGTIIKIRFKIIPDSESSSITVNNRTLMIDGVNISTII